MAERRCPNGHVIEAEWDTCKYCPAPVHGGVTKVVMPTRVVTDVDIPGSEEGAGKKAAFGKTLLYGEKKDEDIPPLLGWLVVTEGKRRWQDFRVTNQQLVIGRDKACDIVVDDEHASSRHASVRLKEGKLFITDLDSGNGTLVNDEEIARAELEDDAIIKIGDTKLRFRKL